MSATLILVRHGQSIYNEEKKFTGQADVALTEKGIKQAEKAATLILDLELEIDHCFTSHLTRAKDTLSIIKDNANISCKTESDAALNEIDFGKLTHMKYEDVLQKFGKAQLDIWKYELNEATPNGESNMQLINRVSSFFRTDILTKLNDGANVLVVAHHITIKAILCALDANQGPDRYKEILRNDIANAEPITLKL